MFRARRQWPPDELADTLSQLPRAADDCLASLAGIEDPAGTRDGADPAAGRPRGVADAVVPVLGGTEIDVALDRLGSSCEPHPDQAAVLIGSCLLLLAAAVPIWGVSDPGPVQRGPSRASCDMTALVEGMNRRSCTTSLISSGMRQISWCARCCCPRPVV